MYAIKKLQLYLFLCWDDIGLLNQLWGGSGGICKNKSSFGLAVCFLEINIALSDMFVFQSAEVLWLVIKPNGLSLFNLSKYVEFKIWKVTTCLKYKKYDNASNHMPLYVVPEVSFDLFCILHSITITFFAKEGEDCNLTPMKEGVIAPVTVQFEQGLGQKFRQPSGTGIDFSLYEEAELVKAGEMDVYPLAVKAEALPTSSNNQSGGSTTEENPGPAPPAAAAASSGGTNSQITQAVFEKDKDKGEFHVRVVKQILWVNGMRYELQEIYGIGNSVDGDFDGNDPGKECVICLSEPRDTTVLPCRHMVLSLSLSLNGWFNCQSKHVFCKAKY